MLQDMKFDGGWKVLDAVDTRNFDPETGKAIPGTGDPMPCECCGKTILIHVLVAKGDERATVGQACAIKSRVAKKIVTRLPCQIIDACLAAGFDMIDARSIRAAVRDVQAGRCANLSSALNHGADAATVARLIAHPCAREWHDRAVG